MSTIHTTNADVNPAELWDSWTDEDRWTITLDENEWEMLEAEEKALAEIRDLDLLESTREYLLDVEMMELEWPGTREEYEAWLDSLQPCEGELESRDLAGSWDFGHMESA